MELPHIGKQCSESTCKRLDFLPMKCDACSGIFCSDHIQYVQHNCTESYKKNKQVPVCPLCNKPIPLGAGEVADVKVSAHIDTDCQSDPAKQRRKVYVNRCTMKGCKTKEMVPVFCDRCKQNFCLKHRHEKDHGCTATSNNSSPAARRNAGASAAMTRQAGSSKTQTPSPSHKHSVMNSIGRDLAQQRDNRTGRTVPLGQFQGGMTEDEAFRRALELSTQPTNTSGRTPTQQELDDEAYARALQASEQENRRRQQSNQSSSSESKCIIN